MSRALWGEDVPSEIWPEADAAADETSTLLIQVRTLRGISDSLHGGIFARQATRARGLVPLAGTGRIGGAVSQTRCDPRAQGPLASPAAKPCENPPWTHCPVWEKKIANPRGSGNFPFDKLSPIISRTSYENNQQDSLLSIFFFDSQCGHADGASRHTRRSDCVGCG